MKCPYTDDLRLEIEVIRRYVSAAEKGVEEVLKAQKREVEQAMFAIGRARQRLLALSRKVDELEGVAHNER